MVGSVEVDLSYMKWKEQQEKGAQKMRLLGGKGDDGDTGTIEMCHVHTAKPHDECGH